jgi:hypothetical protein
MSHQAVRTLIQTVAQAIAVDVSFGYGRGTDFNQIKDKEYPYVWLDPLSSTFNINEENMVVTETYSVNIVFYKFDRVDSVETEYDDILDSCDTLVQTFLRDMNEALSSNYNLSTLSTQNTVIANANKQPFIKVMDDCLTGFILTFELTVPDKFDYCA